MYGGNEAKKKKKIPEILKSEEIFCETVDGNVLLSYTIVFLFNRQGLCALVE